MFLMIGLGLGRADEALPFLCDLLRGGKSASVGL